MERLLALGRDMRKALLPFGSARADWEHGTATLGTSLTTDPRAASAWPCAAGAPSSPLSPRGPSPGSS